MKKFQVLLYFASIVVAVVIGLLQVGKGESDIYGRAEADCNKYLDVYECSDYSELVGTGCEGGFYLLTTSEDETGEQKKTGSYLTSYCLPMKKCEPVKTSDTTEAGCGG